MRSVLDQGYPNLEYIVIDGGSKDDSVDVIRKYADRLTYWVSEKDRGQTHAINKGIERCTGDLFGYINSDDLLLPGSLNRIASEWEKGATWIVGWSKYLEIGGGDWPYTVRPCGQPIDWFLHNPIPQQSSFWAMKYFKQIGVFREDQHYAFDYEFWLRLRFAAQVRPTIIRKCLAAFRLHEVSKTVSQTDRFAPELKQIRQEYRKYLTAGDKLALWRGQRRDEAALCRENVWASLRAKDVKAARSHAISGIRKGALSPISWHVLFCALRGH